MSTDDQPERQSDTVFPGEGYQEIDRGTLGHPLVGVYPRRTALTASALLAFTALFVLSVLGRIVVIDGTPLETQTALFDTVSTVLVLAGAVAITAAPFGYAIWNGGPATAVTIPLVPIVLGALASRRFVLGLDTVIALTVAGAAASVALYATAVHRGDSIRLWSHRSPADVPLLCVTAVTIVGGVAVIRFLRAAPGHLTEWYAPFLVLWVVPIVVLGWYWYDRALNGFVAPSTGTVDR